MLTVQDTLNSELAIILNWISNNGLLLNAKKCESMLFTRSKAQHHQTVEEDISVSAEGTTIKRAISCKLLGVQIDQRLKFSNHVSSCKKTSKQIAIINRFK